MDRVVTVEMLRVESQAHQYMVVILLVFLAGPEIQVRKRSLASPAFVRSD